LLHGVDDDVDELAVLGLGLSPEALFGLAAGRQTLGHPLTLLGPLQDAGDPFHVPHLESLLALQLLGQPGQNQLPEAEVADVEGDAVGGDLLDKHLGGTAVDLLSETFPVLHTAPAAYSV